jgi:hypothetical protein
MDLTGYDYKRKVLEKQIGEKNPAVQIAPRPALVRSPDLTDEAVRLLESLALRCPLAHLPSRFPRVLNRLAALWHQPALVERSLEDLLLDSRGSRAGFPVEVLTELQALRNCNARRISPAKVDPWQAMHLR